MSKLTLTAAEAAHEIETVAARTGAAYHAAQTSYGVEVEALVGEEWVRLRDAIGEEIAAVRFFDCDGERGEECRTVEEVEVEKARWIGLLEGTVEIGE